MENTVITSAGVDRRVPDCSRWTRYGEVYSDRHTIVKTHLLPTSKNVCSAKTKGVIYIQRNPRDVLLSAVNFLHLTKYTNDSPAKIARDFCENFGPPIWKKVGSGSYLDHVYSWRHSGFPTMVVHYESLKTDTAKELRRMVEFLGQDVDSRRIKSAVANCEPSKLRKIEQRERKAGVSPVGKMEAVENSKYFFNKGTSGQSLDSLESGLDDLFNQYFGRVLIDAGYPEG